MTKKPASPDESSAAALSAYRRLLRVLPMAFRSEYEEEMLATFSARYTHAAQTRRTGVGFWVRESVALVGAAWQVRRARTPNSFRRDPLRDKRKWDMSLLFQDVRIAFRSLRKSPTFAFVSVVTIALGIGANTAIFSVVNGVLLTPLDFHNSHELVGIWGEDVNYAQLPIATGDFVDIAERTTLIEEFSARYSIPESLTGEGDPEQITVAWATPNHLPLLGIVPLHGRIYGEDEADAIVLSNELWTRRYAATPSETPGTGTGFRFARPKR